VDTTQLAKAIETVTHRDSIADVVGGTWSCSRVRDAFARQTPEPSRGCDAIARKDAEALASHAHKLKGSMSYFPGSGARISRATWSTRRARETSRARRVCCRTSSAR
jgi:hypothetical protein